MLELNYSLSWSYKGRKGTETLFHTAITTFSGSLGDWSPAFRMMISEVLEPAVADQFATAGQGRWAPLTAATSAAKMRRGQWGGTMGMLISSGKLYNSFQKGSPDHVEFVSRSNLQWGSRVPYGLFHQTGTGKGFQSTQVVATGVGTGAGMPMRKILELSSERKKLMRSIMVQRLATIARQVGFGILSGQTDVDPGLARMAGKQMLGI